MGCAVNVADIGSRGLSSLASGRRFRRSSATSELSLAYHWERFARCEVLVTRRLVSLRGLNHLIVRWHALRRQPPYRNIRAIVSTQRSGQIIVEGTSVKAEAFLLTFGLRGRRLDTSYGPCRMYVDRRKIYYIAAVRRNV